MGSIDDALKKLDPKKEGRRAKRLMRKTNRFMRQFDKAAGGKKGRGRSGAEGGSPTEPPARRGPARAEVMANEAEEVKRTRRGKRGRGKGKGSVQQKATRNTRDVAQETIDRILSDTDYKPELDPKFEDERLGIKEALESSRGKLFELDDATKADFAEQLAAEQALAERQFGVQRDQLLTRLFGQGRTEGQLAGTMGGQLIGDQQLVLQQMSAADAQRRLQTRMQLGAENLQNLGMQQGSLDAAAGRGLAELGLREQARATDLGAATGLEQTYEGADAQRDVARTQASAQRFSATQSRLATQYSADRSLDAARAAASATVKSAGIRAAATRASAMASLQASKYSTNAGLLSNIMSFDQQGSQFQQDLAFRRDNMDLNAQLQREQMAQQQAQFDASQPSTFDKLLGAGTSILGAAAGGTKGFFGFSDERMKSDIQVIPNAVEKVQALDGVLFKWFGSDAVEDGGVIAQQVEQVLPELVQEDAEGRKMVSYHGLIGLLIQAVKELSNG